MDYATERTKPENLGSATQLFNMQAESIDVYCPSCDSACSYFPEVPEICRNCGASFLNLSSPSAGKPADHFPIKADLLALAIVGGAIAGGIAVMGWEHREKKWLC